MAEPDGMVQAQGMIRRPIYMLIDRKHADLPVYIADTPTELAQICGATLTAISHALSRARRNPDFRSKYVCVWTEWTEEEFRATYDRAI